MTDYLPKLNELLESYASPDAEQHDLAAILDELDEVVSLLGPQIEGLVAKDLRGRRIQLCSKDVCQRFWKIFVRHLANKRKKDQPVHVTNLSCIRRYIVLAQINLLLESYASPDADQHDLEATLDELVALLGPGIKRLISQVLGIRWSPHDADDVYQQFWLLFIRHINDKREAGKPLEVTSWNYIRSYVMYAAGLRGGDWVKVLNREIHKFLHPSQYGGDDFLLRDALRRGVTKALKDIGFSDEDAKDQTQRVADAILHRIASLELWCTPLCPPDWVSNPQFVPTYVRAKELREAVQGHVSGVSVAAPYETSPLATAEAVFRSVIGSVSREIGLISRERFIEIINAEVGRLTQEEPAARHEYSHLWRLYALLFLPSYRVEGCFAEDYGMSGATKNNCKAHWIDCLITGVVGEKGLTVPVQDDEGTREVPVQQVLLKAALRPRIYAGLIIENLDFGWLECSAKARAYLEGLPKRRIAALEEFWRLASGCQAVFRFADLAVLEVNDGPPERLHTTSSSGRERPGLVLVTQEESDRGV